MKNGKLAMERYFAGEDERWGDKLGRVAYAAEMKHDLRSISKSVTSLLVGIALGEGKFPKLDSPVFDAFPDYADLKSPEKARITFRDLLVARAIVAQRQRDHLDGGRRPGRPASLCRAVDLVVMINAGHYRSPLQTVIPADILNRIVLPAVKD